MKRASNADRPIQLVDLAAEFEAVGDRLREEVDRVLRSGQFVLGADVGRLEGDFADLCQCKHAVGVGSGSAALELALQALKVGPGDEVIVPAHTFIATIMAVINVGASPVLVDVDEESCCMDPGEVEGAVTTRTKAIMPVHLYGQMSDMKALSRIARRSGLFIVEDAAQAHGATFRGRRAGSMGSFGCFSFYPTKNIGAAGEAGIITTQSARLAKRVAELRNHGRRGHDTFVRVGVNERLDNLQAAVLNVKLAHLESWNERRRESAALYGELLSELPLKLPVELPGRAHVYHQYVVRTRRRRALIDHLKERGIRAGVHYPTPPHRQKVFRDLPFAESSFPVTERLCREVLSLPIHPFLRREEVARVADECAVFFEKQRRAGKRGAA